ADAVLIRPVADDRDQVLRVRAVALVLEVGDLGAAAVAGDAGGEQRAADLVVVARALRVGLGRLARRLLAVDAGEDADDRAAAGLVDRRLDVAGVTRLELPQPPCAHLRLMAEGAPYALRRVLLADVDDLVGRFSVLRYGAYAAVREERVPLGMGEGRGRRQSEQRERDQD